MKVVVWYFRTTTKLAMEELLRHMIFDEEIPDYEFWRDASEWMM